MERAAILETLTRYFAGRPDVIAAYVFGSVARGEAGPASDVDPAIVRAVLESNLGDLSLFVRSIRDRLGRE